MNLQLQIEAIIFATDQAISKEDLLEIINKNQEISTSELEAFIQNSIEKYKQEEFPFQITFSGGGYQFTTKADYYPTVIKINEQKYRKRLSNAALETLSIIAYQQPVTKVDIEQIRGVSADYAIQRLLERNLVYIAGRKEDAIGKPLLYRTTEQFMDYIGINDIAELPKLSELPQIEDLSTAIIPETENENTVS